jgi:hypothetical protein
VISVKKFKNVTRGGRNHEKQLNLFGVDIILAEEKN